MDFRKREAAPNPGAGIDLSLVSDIYVRKGFLHEKGKCPGLLCVSYLECRTRFLALLQPFYEHEEMNRTANVLT